MSQNKPDFTLSALAGKTVDTLIGVGENEQSGEVEILVLQLVGDPHHWHRIYLDGIGFWSISASKDDAYAGYEELQTFNRVDYSELFRLSGKTMVSARCIGTPEDDPALSRFEFRFEHGCLTLRHADENDMESATKVLFSRSRLTQNDSES